jgi:hypothetical protein
MQNEYLEDRVGYQVIGERKLGVRKLQMPVLIQDKFQWLVLVITHKHFLGIFNYANVNADLYL